MYQTKCFQTQAEAQTFAESMRNWGFEADIDQDADCWIVYYFEG